MKKGLYASVTVVVVLVLASLLVIRSRSGTGTPKITVVKNPSCVCCSKWIEYLETGGFDVDVELTDDPAGVKRKLGVPLIVASCHSATIDGYVVEGHVPVSAIERLLDSRPTLSGIAVPGMPIGSPGMIGPKPQRYQVMSFYADGRTDVFLEYEEI